MGRHSACSTACLGVLVIADLLHPMRARAALPQAKAGSSVFVIVMENHDSTDMTSTAAPYIARVLPRLGARALRYYTPSGVHPSLPNYLWLEAGTALGVRNDVTPAVGRQTTSNHLVTLLRHAQITWRTYVENIDGATCPIRDSYPYATRHNPVVYFDDVTQGNNPRSRYCIVHERPFLELRTDLLRGHEARYNFIVPNVCHDMHDSCAPLDDPVRQGDRWLSHNVPMILSSAAYRRGGVLFILWDEGRNGSDGPLPMFVLSQHVKHGYASRESFTHSSTLRTIEEIFGLHPLLGGARHSNDLRHLFKNFP